MQDRLIGRGVRINSLRGTDPPLRFTQVNPILYRWVGRMEAALARSPTLWQFVNRRANSDTETSEAHVTLAHRAVVVGYGPIGQTVVRLLHDGGIEPVIIEMNLETTRRVRQEGHRVVYGDATHSDVLEAAGIRTAVALIVSGPSPEQGPEIVRVARKMNSNLRVVASSHYLRETTIMRRAGADEVFSGEGEAALAMAEYILGILGATPEQMDRERQRVHQEVFRRASQF